MPCGEEKESALVVKGQRKQHERDASDAWRTCDNFVHSLPLQPPDKLPLKLLVREGLGPVLLALPERYKYKVPCRLDDLPRRLARIYFFP